MKTAKKALLLVLCGCLLVAGSVLGTMAYFTSQDEVVNTFTVGKVEISLDEALTNEYGVAQGTERIPNDTSQKNGNEYKMIPGHTYVKDPTVTVAAESEDCYVRAMVTISERAALDVIFKNHPNDFAVIGDKGIISALGAGWEVANVTVDDADNRIYEIRYNQKVVYSAEAQKLSAIFESIKVPAVLTGAELNTLEDLQITVVAHAIQADGFTDAADAWSHFAN